MYRVYCDGYLLYHSRLENLKIFNPTLELELNKTGSFEFSINQNHPYFHLIKKLKPIITVFQDGYMLFRGRILDDNIGWYNGKEIVCEGELSFFLDSIQRPYDFSGGVAEFLGILIENHNAQVDEEKRFVLGDVTVTDPNDYITRSDIDYVNTWEVIEKKLIDLLGGYIIVRHENGVNYIDYLSEIKLLSSQKIQFGKNLLDMKRIRKGEDIATVIIPLGAKLTDDEGNETETRLTIESVNGSVDFVQDTDAIAQFGTIVKTVIFDDVTDPENLKTKGLACLADSVKDLETVELTAADLATVNEDITSFHLGTQVQVTSDPHGIDQLFTVSKLSIKLFDPASNKLVLGKTVKAFSEAMKGIVSEQGEIIQAVEKVSQDTSEVMRNVERNVLSTIEATAENIQSVVAENYYLKEETDSLVSSVSTTVEQTKNSVEIQFEQFNTDIQAVAQNMDAEFESFHKYIRFEDGNIIQGADDSPFQKIQSATKESYYDNGTEVAYFSNQALHVTDGEFLHSLRLGDFAFMPRENGNISFKKII